MDRRFLLFLALSFAVLFTNFWIMRQFAPPPEAPAGVDQNLQAPEGDENLAADPQALPADGVAGQVSPDDVPGDPVEVDGTAEPDEPPVRVVAAQQPDRFHTLGSIDPESPYRMLVTFTSRGAAVERLELGSQDFLDLQDRSGYLGHLEAITAPDGGALVRVVGDGTPARIAGLEPGDVITALGDQPVASAAQLHDRLAETSPGDEIRLKATRDAEVRDLTATLSWRPLEVMRPERENVLLYRETLPDGFEDPPSFLLTMSQIGGRILEGDEIELPGIAMRDSNWEIVDDLSNQEQVTFRSELASEGLVVDKIFRVAKVPETERSNSLYPAYHLEMEVRIQNQGTTQRIVGYQLDGPTGLPIEGWWYANKIGRQWGAVGLRDVAVRFLDGDPLLIPAPKIAEGETEALGQGNSLMYMGVDAQYFAAVMIPKKAAQSDVWFTESRAMRVGPEPAKSDRVAVTNVTTRMTSQPIELAPDMTASYAFTIFTGPKKPALLAEYQQPGEQRSYNLDPLVYYGWFTPVAKVMLSLLHFFESVVGNYGVAIVLLTVLVRSCLFPLSRKQALNMQKMQELQPEIKKITEKYKTDLEKRTRAQQELFRKHNYHPLAGCLPMFLQFPIFIGLYRSLMVDVELRQAPLISDAVRWCSNLSAPDMLWNWTSIMPGFISDGQGIFGLGPYFNILPIVTVVLFVVQTKMFMPPPADEQAALQQKVMKYMFLFMGILFYKVASGLCLYFIASTLWGMAERKLIPKTMAAKSTAVATSSETKKKSDSAPSPGPNGSNKGAKGKKKQKKR